MNFLTISTFSANANIWTIIFLMVAGQGLFISSFLYTKKSYFKKSNFFLATLLAFFSLNLLENVALWTQYLMHSPHFTNVTLSFTYLYGPLFYFFIIYRIKNDRKFNWKDLFHLIPFFVFNYRMLDFYELSSEIKLNILTKQMPYSVNFWTFFWQYLAIFSLLMYLFLSIREISTHKIESKNNLKKIMLSFALFCALIALYFVINILMNLNVHFDYLITLIVSIFIFQIGYFALSEPKIFDPFLYKIKSKTKYEKSNLSNKESIEYLTCFEELMEKEKLYLKKNLKINEVADTLSISTNHLSQALNESSNKTFIEFINFYRVEEAKKMLLNPQFDNLTIEAIAYECGFNNKTSFNKYFKKIMIVTPKEFMNNYKIKHFHVIK